MPDMAENVGGETGLPIARPNAMLPPHHVRGIERDHDALNAGDTIFNSLEAAEHLMESGYLDYTLFLGYSELLCQTSPYYALFEWLRAASL